MLTFETRLRPNEEEVAAKVIDGEAILINLSNGMYYSMDEVGGLVWEMIEGEHSLGEIAAGIATCYDISSEVAEADVHRLADELVRESLVMVSTAAAAAGEIRSFDGQRDLPYETPGLVIYRDLGDLLALDPPMPSQA